MQRYRVNIPLLVGLVVGTLVLTVGGFFFYRFQQTRNADRLLVRADDAREEGDIIKSISFLNQYTNLRPEDTEAQAKLANTYADLVDEPDVQRRQIFGVLSQLESTVRAQPDNATLRRRLADLLIRFRDMRSALVHINQLLNQTPNDPELELLRSDCLFSTKDSKVVDHAFRLIGYDQEVDGFDATKAIAPEEPKVYVRLATTLRADNQEDLADRIADQMVEANPESGQALLYRGQYVSGKDKDQAKEDFKAALEIDPDDPAIIIANSQILSGDEEFEKAKELLEAAVDRKIESYALYQSLAGLASRDGDYEKAIAIYDQGISDLPLEKSHSLIFLRTRLLIEQKQFEEAEVALSEMKIAAAVNPPMIKFLEARLEMAQNNWIDAARKYEKLKVDLAQNQALIVELNYLLGFCYEKLGQSEKALDSFEVALQTDPQNKVAIAGRVRMLNQLGRASRSSNTSEIFTALAEEIAKPKAQQDWDSFNEIINRYVEQRDLSPAMRAVLEAEVLMRRELYPEARAKLIDSYNLDKDNIGVRRAAVKLFAADPGQGPVKALKLLDKVVDDFDDMPILRLDRADLLISINDEELTDQLFALTKNLDSLDKQQKVQLWNGMSTRFQRLRDRESQQYCMQQVADLSPSELPTLISLMLMASQSNDEAGMKDAQDRILKVVGSKDDATWLFTESHRLITQYRNQSQDPEILANAKQLVKRAMEQRPEWNQLYLLQANIDLLGNNAKNALKNFDRASELGRPTALSLYQHAKLLMQFGRYSDVLIQLDQMSPEIRTRLLGREYAESLFRVGRRAEALVAAEDYASAAPKNGDVQFWYGNFIQSAALQQPKDSEQRATLLAKAGKAFDLAIESQPEASNVWLALISHRVATSDLEAAEEAIRKAQINLIEDDNLLFFARCYEIIGRWVDAESLYKQAVEVAVGTEPKARAIRLLARYYLSPTYPRNDKFEKATPLINDLLKQVADGDLDKDDDNVRWARSTAARILAASGEYQKLLDAERILSTNAFNGTLRNEDRLLMAEILAPRPEPVSRLKAVRLFEQVRQSQPLSLEAELTLGKLYFALGDWRNCREQMIDSIARFSKEPSIRVAYIQMLLDRGGPTELDMSIRQLKRLKEMAPTSFQTRELIARVAMKRGKVREGVAALKGMLPRDLKLIKEEELPIVRRVAARLADFESYEAASALYRLAAEQGNGGDKIANAQFVGANVNTDRGLEQLDSLRAELGELKVARAGVYVLRKEIEKALPTQEQFDKVADWIARGLRDDPRNPDLKTLKAEIFDMRQDYPTAIALYRELLEGEELTGIRRAIVLNNLAYMMALSEESDSSIADAKDYIAQAISLLGPRSDILDTRAMILIAAGEYSKAISDLELAVTDLPTASKFFHKAIAHLRSGENEQAARSWEKSLELGLERSDVSALEKAMFDEIKSELEGLGLVSASL